MGLRINLFFAATLAGAAVLVASTRIAAAESPAGQITIPAFHFSYGPFQRP